VKITNSDLIKNREKELLEVISGDLDRETIRQLLAAKYSMDLDSDSLVCRDGDLVVHENQVAYKLAFRAEVILSLLFNRQGDCLDIESVEVEQDAADKTTEAPDSGAYATVSAEEEDLEVPESGAYATVSTGEETDADIPESGAYTAVSSGETADLEIPESGAYAAVSPGPDTEPEDAPEIENVQDPDADKDNPATRMASSIADMISDINKV